LTNLGEKNFGKDLMPLNRSSIVFFDATRKRRERNRLGQSSSAERGQVTGLPKIGVEVSAESTVVPKVQVMSRKNLVPSLAELQTSGHQGNRVTFAPQNNHAATESSTLGPLSAEELEQFLVNFVVEQTGYPAEIVELDADLEADLGIDSIKKAQLFGELREYFDVTPSDDLRLDDFPTLRHIRDFLLKTQGLG
jgi:acyl carrier protein